MILPDDRTMSSAKETETMYILKHGWFQILKNYVYSMYNETWVDIIILSCVFILPNSKETSTGWWLTYPSEK